MSYRTDRDMRPEEYLELVEKEKDRSRRKASSGTVFKEAPLILPEFDLKKGMMRDILERATKNNEDEI